jgi:hypothetical protein
VHPPDVLENVVDIGHLAILAGPLLSEGKAIKPLMEDGTAARITLEVGGAVLDGVDAAQVRAERRAGTGYRGEALPGAGIDPREDHGGEPSAAP